ncbi:MAG: Gldg family protein [Proteobacteria bacterium]|nr:Gldg family protein [Pseudomonadota bacterium]
MKNWLDTLRVPVSVIGYILIFCAGRYFDGQVAGRWMLGSAIALILGAVAIQAQKTRQGSNEEERRSAKYPLMWQLSSLVGIGLYFAYRKLLGQATIPDTMMGKLLLGSWLSLLTISIIAGIGIEWSYFQSGNGRFAESRRVARAAHSWTLVGLLFCIVASLNFVSVKKDYSWDWSYLKTAKPSESTKKILESLDQELKIGIFYGNTNEVLAQIKTYFSGVNLAGSKVKLEYFDAEINPQAAEEFRSSRNGQIVFRYGDSNERIDLGSTLSTARKTLKNLDAEVQKTILVATQKKKVLYFTAGHGEFSWEGSDEDGLKQIKLLENFLRSQNYSLRNFGMSEGSLKKVPDDADAVVIVGGHTPMLSEEAAVLKAYVEGGGSLLVFLDLDAPQDKVISSAVRDTAVDPLVKMLGEVGVRFKAVPLANATNYMTASKTEADTWFLYTNGFTSHESIASLARNDQRAALLTFRSGYLEVTSEFNGWQNFETVRSLPDTFADENKNFKFDEGKEKPNLYVQGVATSRKDPGANGKKGKIVTLSDASAASDLLIRNQGNVVYIAEALRWLSGSPIASASSGVPTSEEDIRIRHTRNEDLIWFYVTVAAVPLLILGIGYMATRRAKRKR